MQAQPGTLTPNLQCHVPALCLEPNAQAGKCPPAFRKALTSAVKVAVRCALS